MSENSSSFKIDTLSRTKAIFYNCGADAKITFSNGEEIKVNKSLLACNGSFFFELFFGESPKSEYLIPDFDAATFQLFLDCLVGCKPYTDLDSLLIFPIAHKYRTEESIKKCIEALKPEEMSETVCHTLNLALYYECQELVDYLINFFDENFHVVSLLETEEFCSILEPISMAKLIENIKMDSSLVKIICSWAEKYIKKRKKSGSVGSFMKEHKIFNKVQKFQFESFQSIFDLQDAKETKDLFTEKQFRSFIKDGIFIQNPRRFPNDSKWVLVRKGGELTENCLFVNPLIFWSDSDIQITLQIWRNETIFLDQAAVNENTTSCKVEFVYSFYSNYYGDYQWKCSDVYTFNEDSGIKKDGKYIYEILSPTYTRIFILHSLNVTYNFNVDCRILKTSMDGLLTDNRNALYYTYNINKKTSE